MTAVVTAGDFLVMLQDKTVQVYLLVLAIAIWKCTSLYHKTLNLSSSSAASSSQNNNQRHQSGLASIGSKLIPPFLSIAIIGITWFYIFRFILTNQFTSESYFDDAYKDVLREHYFTSTQLLTWAVVSVIWVTSEGDESIPFLLFGFLGAMGASFALWVPSRIMKKTVQKRAMGRKYIPFVYIITSIIAFYCILKIRPCQANNSYDDCLKDQGFGSFATSFRFYLHGLHYVLLLPIGITFIIPARKQPMVDSTFVYAIMGIVFSIWNVSQIFLLKENNFESSSSSSSLYHILQTDCQKSIHIDLLCCSLLTLYAIFNDTHYHTIITSFGALLIPIISPAAVLSFHLCLQQLPVTYQHLVQKMQHQMALHRRRKDFNARSKTTNDSDGKNRGNNVSTGDSSEKGRGWCNLGLWKTNDSLGECSYDDACENLALALAKEADLKGGDGVLSCGCGVAGNELELYYSRFNLNHITGIDPCVDINPSSAFDVQNVRRIRVCVEDLICRKNSKVPYFRPYLFNKILALDNIYHYPDKRSFFRYCMETLSDGGKVAVTDIIWKRNDPALTWVKLALSAMGVQSSTVWTANEYKRHLENLGFSNVIVKCIGSQVFGGWKGLLPSSLIQYLDYSIIVASKNEETEQRTTKKKQVAVIGSGMAGLVTAYTISNSLYARDIEVKVFEAADRPGLAGNTVKVGEQLVDVPARMAALGYYEEYLKLVEKLGIRYQAVNTDCIFHGQDGAGKYVKYIYEQSAWLNFFYAVFLGGVENLWKTARAFSSIPSFLASSSENKYNSLSFGDWLHGHLNLYPPSSTKSNNPTKHQGWQFSYFAQHENAFLYMAIGSFSWMLSCTYQQLIACPSDILLPYIDGLGLTKFLGVFKEASTIRIEPSIKAVEHALLYGIAFEGNTKVCNLDENKIINGVKYDAIVCATEASAVPCVIQNCADVFKKFHYHPSTIYLHNDSSMLAASKSDWRTWEVRMEPEREEAQLTFWLNRYYEDIDFDGDVFQTWAPIKPPKPECIIRKFYMSRVVHTSASKDMVQLVQKEQGKRGGYYYAGSYTVYGMGLLEEATASGKLAAEHVLKDLFHVIDS